MHIQCVNFQQKYQSFTNRGFKMNNMTDVNKEILNDTAIANKLIMLRMERKLSQEQVAGELGVSKSTYCRMEKKANFSAGVLGKLLEYYDITYEQFYQTKLPVEKYISYSAKYLEALKATINTYGKPDISASWGENRDRYHKLKEALAPVLEEREKQMAIPDFNIDESMVGQTIVTYKFDAYAEWLIDQCLAEQQKLLDAICG